jgi:hypothetical protein
LRADGVVVGNIITLTEATGWTYEWAGLNKYHADGVTEIVYTVDEISVPEHYTKSVNGGTITNTCTYVPAPETVDFVVEKIVQEIETLKQFYRK